MTVKEKPQRFTLRKEYFGGIIHDVKTMSCELLTPKEFLLLSDFKNGKFSFVKDLERLDVKTRNTIDRLQTKGVIAISDSGKLSIEKTRFVEPPLQIPQGCLTAPIRVYDTYTKRCNLNCEQCFVNNKSDFPEVRRTTEETRIIMEKFYEVGTMEWRFTGGEPVSCPDLFEVIKVAKTLGMAVMLNTNGCWNETISERVLNSGINEIIVSLEGREKINNKRRGAGVFNRVMQTLNRIATHNKSNSDQKIGVTLNMTIAKDNIAEVDFVVHLGANYGYNINFVPLRPYGNALKEMKNEMLSTEEYMRFSEKVQKLREEPIVRNSGIKLIHRNTDLFCPNYPDKSKNPFPFNYSECGSLSTSFGLCPDGRANVCSFLMNDPRFLGPNLLEVSVHEAWLHPKMELFRRVKKIGCIACKYYMRQCEGKCRVMVLGNGGKIVDKKLIGDDPYCYASLMTEQNK